MHLIIGEVDGVTRFLAAGFSAWCSLDDLRPGMLPCDGPLRFTDAPAARAYLKRVRAYIPAAVKDARVIRHRRLP